MNQRYRFPFSAMGTVCELQLYAQDAAQAELVALLAMAEVARIEGCYSRYREDSLLSAINRVASIGGETWLDEETAELLNYGFTCYQASEGMFDLTSGILRQAWDFGGNRLPTTAELTPLLARVGMDKLAWEPPYLRFTVPGMALDFGGLGKEYAADRVAEICLEQGLCHGLIDLGGDIRVLGPHPDGQPWLVGIQHSRQAETMASTIPLAQGAIAGSGDYERYLEVDGQRYGHILNPFTGWPVRGLSAVHVVAEQCLVAGSFCTLAMLKGKAAIPWLEGLGISHLWLDQDGQLGGTLA